MNSIVKKLRNNDEVLSEEDYEFIERVILERNGYSIEDLKCCGNCAHFDILDSFDSFCYPEFDYYGESFLVSSTHICEEWEFDTSLLDRKKA